MAENYLKTKDSAKLTVQQMRRMVRQQIEEVRRIEYDLDESKKSGYLRRIISDIKLSGHVNVSKSDTILKTKVKYMRKKQLQTLYNELQGVINADRESMQYARKQANRKEQMRRKTNKQLPVKLSEDEYQTWLDLWDEFGEEMETYGYNELAKVVHEKDNSGKSAKNIIEDLDAIKDLLSSYDIEPTPGRVLIYANNRDEIEQLWRENPQLTLPEIIKRLSTHK